MKSTASTTHPVSILTSMQVVVIIAGTFAVRLMTMGYEEPGGWEWPGMTIFLRNFGWLVLGVPAIWAIGSLVLERRCEAVWDRWWTVGSGLVIFLALLWIFVQAMGSCYML